MIPLKPLRYGCYAFCLAAATASAQQPVERFESPVERVTVVELFTSHGCSSCPPAESWLRKLEQSPGLWQQVIPLAFHVDYWDYLGWKDRFADAAFSQRQRDYRHNGSLGSVYTPGLLVNGQEWRGWYWGRAIPHGKPQQVGRLALEGSAEAGLTLRFTPGPDWQATELRAHFAILGNGVNSHIGTGENRGRELQESFVVLVHTDTTDTLAPHTWRLDWPAVEPPQTKRQALVAWLSGPQGPTPLQAVGGWLTKEADR
jgi:hypothetical protein